MDDRLQKFVRLVDIGNFTRAARELHISQPALTAAINKLERELRVKLLIRGNRRFVLTDAGDIAYKAALEHKSITENLIANLDRLSGIRPKVSIGMIDSIAVALSKDPRPLDLLEETADVSIVVNNSRYLREAVTNHTLDIAFVVEDGNALPGLEKHAMGSEPLVIVCPPQYVETAQAEIAAGLLTHFICYDQPSVTYQRIHRSLSDLRINIMPTLFSTSPDVMLSMVLRNKGVAALPALLTNDHIHTGRLAYLKKDGHVIAIERPISLVRLSGRVIPTQLSTFSRQAESVLRSVTKC